MSVVPPDLRNIDRGRSWRWWVCCLLLLATMINYMDRLTLNLLKVHINSDLGLDNRDYANLEAYFGLAFAAGAILFGFLVDRWNVFWVYPLALIGWSLAGIASGYARGFWDLIVCRMVLGLFEAANWPCALRTTQRILPPSERSMGNSILQSGAAVGAIVIPLVLLVLFDEARPQTWRLPFMVVGAVGMLWVFLWVAVVRPADLALLPATAPATAGPAAPPPLPRGVFVRRFAVLIVLVVTINMTWHFLRAWLPSFLMEKHHFTQNQTNFFSAGYYVFTDLGALTAGFASLRLVQLGGGVHASRRFVFLVGALLATLCLAAAFLPSGWGLVGVLFLVGFGALGMFPCYYSFSQDLTARNQGKVTGTLGACCWGAMYIWQQIIGQWVHYTQSYTLPFVIAGLAPLVGFAALLLLWGPAPAASPAPVPVADEGRAPALHPAPDERTVAAGTSPDRITLSPPPS
jgi:ACS family hexuronate transporter-like MFS transporter